MNAPAVRSDEPCQDPTRQPCHTAWACAGCKGDGTRTVYTDAPAGSVLLSPEQAAACRVALSYVQAAHTLDPTYDDLDTMVLESIAPALDALGVER